MEATESQAMAETETFISQPRATVRKRKSKSTCRNPKRFTDEQIRSLESVFNQETKLDQRMKQKLARDLGLEPRQVAIWFQNKRARWKSKQMEQEYRDLKKEFDTLTGHVDSLRKEKASLIKQLQTLNGLIKGPHRHGFSTDRDPDQGKEKVAALGDTDRESSELMKEKARVLNAEDKHDEVPARKGKADAANYQEPNDWSWHNSPLGAPETERWCDLDSGDPLDQSCGSSNWWYF